MVVTAATFQPAMFLLNAAAPRNIDDMVVTAPVSHAERLPVKALAP